ncbi:MAG: DUF192 domain-containing protein [Gammaproteobacteria bacterium]|nr:DUF192 domain-containing protein [Gammaproteobacteria bacterium]
MISRTGSCLIHEVEYADTPFRQAIGLMFRRKIRDDYALVFRLKKSTTTDVHMLFVPFGIDIVFLDMCNRVVLVDSLDAWSGRVRITPDVKTIIEMNGGVASLKQIKVGDVLGLS